MSLLPGIWAQQRCPRRRSHERTYKEDPTGTNRSACSQCRIDTNLAWHMHVDDHGHTRYVCFNEYDRCEKGTENAAWIHKAKVPA